MEEDYNDWGAKDPYVILAFVASAVPLAILRIWINYKYGV